MRRRKDDKRVLRPGNNNSSSKRFSFKRGNNRIRYRNDFNRANRNRRPKKPAKPRNNKVLFLMILALVAFLIGAGVGISMSLEGDNEGPHVENVTAEMTTNVTDDSNEPVYDSDIDSIDYNDEETLEALNITDLSK